jgi:hypothetical protein
LYVRKNILTENIEDSQSQNKACWTREMLNTFCDICIKAIEKGMRPNTHFDKVGWKYVMNCFKEQTDYALMKAQLKNMWGEIKKDWRILEKFDFQNRSRLES